MGEKKTDWAKYTKEELILILDAVETNFVSFPWIVRDAVDAVERMRLDDLRHRRDQFEEEAHQARLKASELLATGKRDLKTLNKINELFKKASAADKGYERMARKIDRALGIR